jgi:hypothetical protein
MSNRTRTPGNSRLVRRLLISGFTALALVAAAIPPATSAPPPEQGISADDEAGSSRRWVPQPPLRHARAGHSVVTVDGKIFAIGGFRSSTRLDSVEARRVTGHGVWRDMPPLPTARSNHVAAELHGLVYVAGGFDLTGNLVNVVEVFHPKSGRWTTGVPLPERRAGAGGAVLDGLLYVAGGGVRLSDGTYPAVSSMIVYDPSTGAWRSAAPMPAPRDRHRLVASGRYLYAIGGFDRLGQSVATVERYDPRSNSWRVLKPMHKSRVMPCAVDAVVGHRHVIVVVGGAEYSAGGVLVGPRSTTEVFDLATGQWTVLNVLLPFSRASLDCATTSAGTVLAIGGASAVGSDFTFYPNVDALTLKPHDLK